MNAIAFLVCLVAADPLETAGEHLNHGRYEEALDAFAEAEQAGADRVAIALGVSRVQIETGKYDDAAAAIAAGLNSSPDNADLLARRGELRMLRGDVENALQDAESALKQKEDHLAAHWVKADALTETGRIAEASDECRWFVRYYNRMQPTDAEDLVYVAKGSLRYARWNRVSSIFHFVIGDLCPDLAKADPDDWRADAISGALLLEKYNEAQGKPDLQKALAKNPNAASVHATLATAAFDDRDFTEAKSRAEAALAINPSLVEALGVNVDLAIADGDLPAARKSLATALAVNPHDQELLARRVAIELLAGSLDTQMFGTLVAAIETGDPSAVTGTSESESLVADLLRRNPKPAYFLVRLGTMLERRRLYREAELTYETAIAVMPELSEPQVSLGLLTMRAGDLARAKTILDAAFKADPFHVRVSNMRKVIELLEGYETLESPHFLIRFDPANDRILAELTAEYLEGAYPKLTSEFGFEPPKKTVIELFHRGKGQSGHQWFSARMVGLPWLQTIGASTGLMIALASPTSGPEYNWARVVRHEFTHVITLQQTEFRIPHWYTEALAVRSEGFPRPEKWDELLRQRVPKKELRQLDELNAAFIRPGSSDDWQFAYCQSLLYAEYLDEQFGKAVHRKLLDGYTAGLTTEAAISKATGVGVEEFEASYRKRLASIADRLGPPTEDADPPAEVVAALKAAAAAVREKENAKAIAILDEALDRDAPQPKLLAALGKLTLLDGKAAEAAKLFALGRERLPHDRSWIKLQAAALLKAGDSPELKSLLEEIANTDADDALAAKKLAELASDAGDAAATKRWSLRALYVTPNDAELHTLLAEACDTLGESDRAATARRHAKLCEQDDEPTDAGDE